MKADTVSISGVLITVALVYLVSFTNNGTIIAGVAVSGIALTMVILGFFTESINNKKELESLT